MKTLYFQWVDSEYSGDEMTRLRLTMEFKLDPAPFMSVLEAQKAFIGSEIDYYKKLYFGQWLETLPSNWYFVSNFETLNTQFTQWVEGKMAEMPEKVDADGSEIQQ
jgi:hypothetical protein